jgi:hypothetical protein
VASINLATVIPIPIKSLTFSEDPVVGGNSVTSAVTLKSAALVDIPISVKSTNDLVATVIGTATIPKGATSTTFNIQTLRQTALEQVSIQAFYAQGVQSALTVLPPPS